MKNNSDGRKDPKCIGIPDYSRAKECVGRHIENVKARIGGEAAPKHLIEQAKRGIKLD